MYAILFDANECVGCKECVYACVRENELPESDEETLSGKRFTVLEEIDEDEEWYLRRMCKHCVEPSCASACPVGALKKTELGPVVYDFDPANPAGIEDFCLHCHDAENRDDPRDDHDQH